eukprot:2236651-Pleurochrysis_carterae.AAC.1
MMKEENCFITKSLRKAQTANSIIKAMHEAKIMEGAINRLNLVLGIPEKSHTVWKTLPFPVQSDAASGCADSCNKRSPAAGKDISNNRASAQSTNGSTN